MLRRAISAGAGRPAVAALVSPRASAPLAAGTPWRSGTAAPCVSVGIAAWTRTFATEFDDAELQKLVPATGHGKAPGPDSALARLCREAEAIAADHCPAAVAAEAWRAHLSQDAQRARVRGAVAALRAGNERASGDRLFNLCAFGAADDDAQRAAADAILGALRRKVIASRGRVEVGEFLDRRFNNASRGFDFALCHRGRLLVELERHVPAPGHAPAASSPKPTLVVASAMRGAGKTTALKNYVGTRQRRLCELGRVLALEPNRDWCRDRCIGFGNAAAGEDAFVAGLIDAHLRDIGCLEDDEHQPPATAAEAYASWVRRTAKTFEMTDAESASMHPLIVIDTCEKFASVDHADRRHGAPPKARYNLLEAIATVIPPGRFVVAFGTLAAVSKDEIFATDVNTVRLAPEVLEPLPLAEALEWYRKNDPHETRMLRGGPLPIHVPTFRVLHGLTGGVPRLLDAATGAEHTSLLVMVNHVVPLLVARTFDAAALYYSATAASTDGAAKRELIVGTMASLTRWDAWPLRVRDANDRANDWSLSLEAAVHKAVGVASGGRLKVPPVFAGSLSDADVVGVTGCASLKLRSIACPLSPDTVAGTRKPATLRGAPFERLMVHALLCRYVIARWQVGAEWVPLRALLRCGELQAAAGADAGLASLLDAWEVNLSGGLVGDADGVADTSFEAFRGAADGGRPPALQWNRSNARAHHDAYMLGRKAAAAGGSGGPPAAPRVIAIQMRHGKPETPDELKPQMLTRPGRGGSGAAEHVPLLLSLHGGETVKDGVYVSQEAKFGRHGASAFPKGSFLEVNAEHLCDASVVWTVDLTGPGAAK